MYEGLGALDYNDGLFGKLVRKLRGESSIVPDSNQYSEPIGPIAPVRPVTVAITTYGQGQPIGQNRNIVAMPASIRTMPIMSTNSVNWVLGIGAITMTGLAVFLFWPKLRR